MKAKLQVTYNNVLEIVCFIKIKTTVQTKNGCPFQMLSLCQENTKIEIISNIAS